MSINFPDSANINTLPQGGGGGGTSNHNELSNLDYASSGHTGFLSNSTFLPHGTTITVNTDGTGDYTNLNDAINFIEGKWSDGVIKIEIGEGTYNTETFELPILNIGGLTIEGAGIDETILTGEPYAYNGLITLSHASYPVTVEKMTFKNNTSAIEGGAVCSRYSGNMTIKNVKAIDYTRGICSCQAGGNLSIYNAEVDNTTSKSYGLVNFCANTYFDSGYFKVNNATTGVHIGGGAFVRANGVTYTITNVTNRYRSGVSKNQMNAYGLVLGSWTEN